MVKKNILIRILGIFLGAAFPLLGHSWSVFMYNKTKKNCQVTINLLWCEDRAQEIKPNSWIKIDRCLCALTSIDACEDSCAPISLKIPFSPLSDSYYVLLEDDDLLLVNEIDSQAFACIADQNQLYYQFYKEFSEPALRQMAKLLLQPNRIEQETNGVKLIAEEMIAEKKTAEQQKKEFLQRALLEQATKIRQAAGEKMYETATPDKKLDYVNTLLKSIESEDTAREDLAKNSMMWPSSAAAQE